MRACIKSIRKGFSWGLKNLYRIFQIYHPYHVSSKPDAVHRIISNKSIISPGSINVSVVQPSLLAER